MKHVQRIVRPNGDVQLYIRKKGLPSIRLKSPEPPAGQEVGSELEKEVQGLLAALTADKPLPRTLAEATRAYELEDADFRGLAASTKYEYRLILKEFDATIGRVPVAHFSPAYVLKLRDAWAVRGHRCANVRRQVLKNVLKRSLIAGQLLVDPFPLVGEARRPRDLDEPHRLWPADVVDLVIRAAIASRKFGLARAVAIARYTGARRGDLVKLNRSVRDEGRFKFRSGKRRVLVDLPEDPELTRWLEAIPAAQPNEPRAGRKGAPKVVRLPPPTLVFNLANEQYTEDGLGLELGKLVGDLCSRGALDSDAFDLHGLRHTRGVEIALAGCTDAQGAAMLGHASPSSFAQYRRQANRIQMADDASAQILLFRARSLNPATGAVKQEVEPECNEPEKNESGAASKA